MKTNSIYLLLTTGWILMLTTACVQSDRQAEVVRPAVITGTILNREHYPHVKNIRLILPFFPKAEKIQSTPISEENTFSFQFSPYILRTIALETFVSHLLIGPGDTLHVNIDFKHLDHITFEGPAAHRNILYSKFIQDGWYMGQMKYSVYEYTEDQFEEELTRDQSKQNQRYRDFIKKYNPDKQTAQWIQDRINLDYCNTRLSFLFYKARIERQDYRQRSSKLEINDKRIEELTPRMHGDEVLFNIMHIQSMEVIPKLIEYGYKPNQYIEQIGDIDLPSYSRQYIISAFIVNEILFNKKPQLEVCDSLIQHTITTPLLRESLNSLRNSLL